MPIKAWVQCLGAAQPALEQIRDGLARSGVQVHGRQGEDYGVLLFQAWEPAVQALLADLDRDCRGRVLAGCCARLTPEHARGLLQAGVADVLHCTDCTRSVQDILARLERWQTVDGLLDSPEVRTQLVGRSPAWLGILRQVVELARFTDAPLLLLGESGTGKEGMARLVHQLDARPYKQELIVLDCSTIMPSLSGSEFFGHERGAFTGAASARDGAFALADRGTLFLDEVGELPLPMQTQLLRVLQEQTFKRVGGSTWQRTAFRLVAATNQDLWALAQRGAFRADLYFRLAGCICRLPPLRDRPEDIPLLANHFLAEGPQGAPPALDPAVEDWLLQRDYPGNVRDLRQVVGRLRARYPGSGPITVGCIPTEEQAAWFEAATHWQAGPFELGIRRALIHGAGIKAISRAAEDLAIRLAVTDAGGNLQQAAQRLGVTDRTLQLRRAAARGESTAWPAGAQVIGNGDAADASAARQAAAPG